MKIKEGMILSEVGEAYVAVPTGKRAKEFHGFVRLNESGAVIWKMIEEGLNEEEIAVRLMEQYPKLELPKAKAAVKAVVENLMAEGLLEE